MSLQPESSFNFLKNSGTSIKSNIVSKFIVLGGAGAAVFNGLFHNFMITGLIESLGVGTAAFITSQVLKGDQNMNTMTNDQLNKHLIKGAFLAIGGGILGGVANILPGPFAHIAHYPTSILLGTGLIAAAEAGYQKFKRK